MKKFLIAFLLFNTISFYLFSNENPVKVINSEKEVKITFLELGSKTCIPCKQMTKVLESVKEKYGDQIDIIFHDIKKNRQIANKYKVRMMPTQVFLDEDGKEIHRHVGYYPEKQIDEFLQAQGLSVIQQTK